MADINNCVLDIPVPKSVRRMLTAPPVCLSKVEDLHILDLIKELGQEFDCCQDEIRQTLNLASGPSDLIIILERPLDSPNYTLTTEEFIRKSPTLNAVDELIKFSHSETKKENGANGSALLVCGSCDALRRQCKPISQP